MSTLSSLRSGPTWRQIPRSDGAEPPRRPRPDSTPRIPIEILALAADYLMDAGRYKTIATLARVSRAAFDLVIPKLYRVVRLHSAWAIRQFYRSLAKWMVAQKQAEPRSSSTTRRSTASTAMAVKQYDLPSRTQRYISTINHIEIKAESAHFDAAFFTKKEAKDLQKEISGTKERLMLESLYIEMSDMKEFKGVCLPIVFGSCRAKHLRWRSTGPDWIEDREAEPSWQHSGFDKCFIAAYAKWLEHASLVSFDLPWWSKKLLPIMHKGRWLIVDHSDMRINCEGVYHMGLEELESSVKTRVDKGAHLAKTHGPSFIFYNFDKDGAAQINEMVEECDILKDDNAREDKWFHFCEDIGMTGAEPGEGDAWRAWLKKDFWGVGSTIGGTIEAARAVQGTV